MHTYIHTYIHTHTHTHTYIHGHQVELRVQRHARWPVQGDSVEPYVYKVFNRAHRSILAQFRNGILPLKIETGRYTQIPIEFRLCILCNEDQIENECHFLFECDFYQHIRDVYYQGFREHCNNFDVMNHTEKLNYLMSADVVKTTAQFIYKCYCKRREFIYK